jgi:AcrR family transcriptional regulator
MAWNLSPKWRRTTMIEGIDQKILLATLDEGGSNPPNRFSTVHIAAACGISEFTVYDHFHTKSHLLTEADVYLGRLLDSYTREASKESSTFAEFFSKMMDFQLAHPTWNGFFLNYSIVFPHFGSEEDQGVADLKKHMTDTAKEVMPKFVTPKITEDIREIFLFFLREVICYSRYIIGGDAVDSPKGRELESRVVFGGLNAFRYVKEKKSKNLTPKPTHVKNHRP